MKNLKTFRNFSYFFKIKGDVNIKCPSCGIENKDGAEYCKNCGTPLNSQKSMNESIRNDSPKEFSSSNKTNSSGSKNTLIICITAIICVIIIAGAFVVLGTDLLNNSNNNSLSNGTDINNTTDNVSSVKKSDSTAVSNEMTFTEAKKLMSGSSNTVIRNTFDEADANGDGVLTGNEISRFKYLADLTDRTADSSNTEHVEATDQGAGDGTTKTRYCTTHGRVAVGSDNLCPYCLEEGLDARTVKDSTEYV